MGKNLSPLTLAFHKSRWGCQWVGIGIEVIIVNKNVTLPSLAQGTFLITWDSLDFLLIDSRRLDVEPLGSWNPVP